eukprot:1052309-Alexandrium_andersonii.AAC.1
MSPAARSTLPRAAASSPGRRRFLWANGSRPRVRSASASVRPTSPCPPRACPTARNRAPARKTLAAAGA